MKKVDTLTYCRNHLQELSFDELREVYHSLSVQYDDASIILSRADPFFTTQFANLLMEYDIVEDLVDKMYNAPNKFSLYDKYVVIGYNGLYSFNDLSFAYRFVQKKMNGDSAERILDFLAK